MLQAEERASAKVEYRSEKFNITIKESRIRLGLRKINVNFGGPLNKIWTLKSTTPQCT